MFVGNNCTLVSCCVNAKHKLKHPCRSGPPDNVIKYQNGEKCDLRDFDCGQMACFEYKLLISLDFYKHQSLTYSEWCQKQTKKTSNEWKFYGWKCFVDERGRRRMARLVGADKNAAVTQITTHYNHCVQKRVSECKTRLIADDHAKSQPCQSLERFLN